MCLRIAHRMCAIVYLIDYLKIARRKGEREVNINANEAIIIIILTNFLCFFENIDLIFADFITAPSTA